MGVGVVVAVSSALGLKHVKNLSLGMATVDVGMNAGGRQTSWRSKRSISFFCAQSPHLRYRAARLPAAANVFTHASRISISRWLRSLNINAVVPRVRACFAPAPPARLLQHNALRGRHFSTCATPARTASAPSTHPPLLCCWTRLHRVMLSAAEIAIPATSYGRRFIKSRETEELMAKNENISENSQRKIISSPGWRKTEISMFVDSKMAGDGGTRNIWAADERRGDRDLTGV